MNNNSQKEPIEILESIFTNVNGWLHFAEAKNGIIASINIAIVTTCIGIMSSNEVSNTYLNSYAFSLVVCLSIAAIIAILSFFPKIDLAKKIKKNDSLQGNIYYFGDIEKMSVSSFLSSVFKKCDVDRVPKGFEQDIAEQIVVNSEIASKKYRFFIVCLGMTLSSLVFPFVFTAINWTFIR